MAGRKTPLDAEITETAARMISHGTTQIEVAHALGFRPETITKWKQRGQAELEIPPNPADYTMRELRSLATDQGVDPELEIDGRVTKAKLAKLLYEPTPYAQFAQALTRANPRGIDHAVSEMIRAGKDDWRMWAHYLAHRDPENWSKHALENRFSTPTDPVSDNAEAILEEGRAVVVAIGDAPSRREA